MPSKWKYSTDESNKKILLMQRMLSKTKQTYTLFKYFFFLYDQNVYFLYLSLISNFSMERFSSMLLYSSYIYVHLRKSYGYITRKVKMLACLNFLYNIIYKRRFSHYWPTGHEAWDFNYVTRTVAKWRNAGLSNVPEKKFQKWILNNVKFEFRTHYHIFSV